MARTRRYHMVVAVLIGIAVCAIDRATKDLVLAHLSSHRTVVLLGGLISLKLVLNPGAAFGFGTSYTAIFALIEAGVVVAILRVSGRLRSWPWAIALGLLLGGAAGNLVDRLFRSPGLFRGDVIDWIKLPYFPPSFNIADSAIVSGAALLILANARGWRADGMRTPPAEEVIG